MKRRAYPTRPGASASRFVLLDRQHQIDTVCRLADSRVSDHGIAQLVVWPVAYVRRVLADRPAARVKE